MAEFLNRSSSTERVAFYGGSFDPPHRAHLAVARAAAQALELDRVLFAPVGSQPLKPNGGAASFADRVAMTRLAIEDEEGFEVSLLDAPRLGARPNYSIDTLLGLRKQLGPAVELYCLMGADSLANLRYWHRAAELPFVATLVVAGRPGVQLAELGALLPEGVCASVEPAFRGLRQGIEVDQFQLVSSGGARAELILLPALSDQTNATELRQLVQSSSDCPDSLLPASVLDYIRAHKLYK